MLKKKLEIKLLKLHPTNWDTNQWNVFFDKSLWTKFLKLG